MYVCTIEYCLRTISSMDVNLPLFFLLLKERLNMLPSLLPLFPYYYYYITELKQKKCFEITHKFIYNFKIVKFNHHMKNESRLILWIH